MGFFHEVDHVDLLARRVLPELARDRLRTRLSVWSAGCGSGEDAWSLAMILDEARLPVTWKVRLLATERDLDQLDWAASGIYPDDRMTEVSPERRRRHFVRGTGARKGLWRVVAALRDRVELVALDLRGPWPVRDPFDIVVCHRALAELKPEAAARLIYRLADALAPGGILLLGPSPWLPTGLAGFELHGRSAYRKMI